MNQAKGYPAQQAGVLKVNKIKKILKNVKKIDNKLIIKWQYHIYILFYMHMIYIYNNSTFIL